MREEILRMDRVTYQDGSVTELHQFCLDVYAGDILGLIPVNDTGLVSLLRLLRQNLPLHYGSVYYRGRRVNRWQQADLSYNRIAVIQPKSGLAADLTVADNVFVMRHGFRKHIISRRILKKQLEPFLQEIGLHLSADTPVRDLSPYHRLVTEIVKAVVADCRLIVLVEPGTVIGDERLSQLHQIMRYYAQKGFAFLYVSLHYEETQQICSRAALMLNGQITKTVFTSEVSPALLRYYGMEKYRELVHLKDVSHIRNDAANPALEWQDLRCGRIRGLSLRVAPGECVVVQDLNNHIFDDLIRVMSGQCQPDGGRILLGGKLYTRRRKREVAVVDKLPMESMLFPQMSYMDNLCFNMDHILPEIWRLPRTLRSIRREWAPRLGNAFDLSVEELSRSQKYDLIYTRVLLQRPKAVVCVQPFMHADMEHRLHIWTLIDELLKKGVAVIILAVNLADGLALADRLVRIRHGRIAEEYARADFGSLSAPAPWQTWWEES